MLFQGEEWGASTPFPYFTDHQDPELAEAVRRGRREEFAAFGWDADAIPDPQAEATFASARLDWEERGREPHAGLLEWHRDLIALRRRLPELVDGDLAAVRVRWDEERRWLIMERGRVVVACLLADAPGELPVENAVGAQVLLTAGLEQAGRDSLHLAARGVAVLGRF
jgi:maltooligosyltrehalose trehalohydrolase